MRSSRSPSSEVTGAEAGDYRFTPEALNIAGRRPGISAFMRIRNGADFLEATIRSHIAHFDEIVAVHNRCTDATPDILARLAAEFGPRLRVHHYLPEVYPPGSDGHRTEPPDSPRSLVNYYNFALAQTRFSHATKLDDDHLGMEEGLQALVGGVRNGDFGREMSCFSGFNLARDAAGSLGILAREPFSGGGDIGIFPVTGDTYFEHDARFERFRRGGLKRRFRGFVYWHLKYLKPGFGFANYDLANNPDSRYARRLKALETGRAVVPLRAVGTLAGPGERVLRALRGAGLPLPEKTALIADRWRAAADVHASLPDLP